MVCRMVIAGGTEPAWSGLESTSPSQGLFPLRWSVLQTLAAIHSRYSHGTRGDGGTGTSLPATWSSSKNPSQDPVSPRCLTTCPISQTLQRRERTCMKSRARPLLPNSCAAARLGSRSSSPTWGIISVTASRPGGPGSSMPSTKRSRPHRTGSCSSSRILQERRTVSGAHSKTSGP
ncbi:MAG: hypothetical protein A4E36_00435 [Methanoregulaceae archaeon PtaB.Bin009]|nr:MAG: hypothetical protein A4E36_00435 [Methanoregulaceae archaeon PtaB.Bin009]